MNVDCWFFQSKYTATKIYKNHQVDGWLANLAGCLVGWCHKIWEKNYLHNFLWTAMTPGYVTCVTFRVVPQYAELCSLDIDGYTGEERWLDC